MTMPLLALYICICLLACGACTATAEDDECSTFPITLDELLLINVDISDRKACFVIDTGASTTGLDRSLRELLGSPIKQQDTVTGGGLQKLDYFSAPELIVFSTPAMTFHSIGLVSCADLSSMKQASGANILGALGMDFMRDRVIRLRFDDGIGEIKNVRSDLPGHVERIRSKTDIPKILLHLPSDDFTSFEIDTGDSDNVTLNTNRFNRLVAKKRIVTTDSKPVAVVGKFVSSRSGILDCLELGPHRFFNVRVSEGSGDRLGLRFLSKFDVEFDFLRRVICFRPGKMIGLPDRRDRAGFGVARADGKTVAMALEDGSPGQLAGIRSGDRIIRIDGDNADDMPLRRIRHLLSEPGADVKLSIEREGQAMAIALTLSDEPDPFPAKSPHELIEQVEDFDN